MSAKHANGDSRSGAFSRATSTSCSRSAASFRLTWSAKGGNGQADQTTGAPLTEGQGAAQMLDRGLHLYELHPFFRITDCNASLSRLRLATSFFRRAFSSRSCLASCASLNSHAAILRFPGVKRVLADANSPRHILRPPPRIHLLQRGYHLHFCVLALRHRPFPLHRIKSYSTSCGFWGTYMDSSWFAGHFNTEFCARRSAQANAALRRAKLSGFAGPAACGGYDRYRPGDFTDR